MSKEIFPSRFDAKVDEICSLAAGVQFDEDVRCLRGGCEEVCGKAFWVGEASPPTQRVGNTELALIRRRPHEHITHHTRRLQMKATTPSHPTDNHSGFITPVFKASPSAAGSSDHHRCSSVPPTVYMREEIRAASQKVSQN